MEKNKQKFLDSKFEQLNLKDLLIKNKFCVTPNQRPYRWDKDKLSELWEDLLYIKKERKNLDNSYFNKNHFFGPMFFVNSGSELDILDGQQRLATVSLLLKVIQDIFEEINHEKNIISYALPIHGEIKTCLFDKVDGELIKRIKMGSRNEDHYSIIITSTYSPKEKISQFSGREFSKTQKKIINCYKFFLEKIIEEVVKLNGSEYPQSDKDFINLISLESSQKLLKDLFEPLMNNFYVLVIKLDSKVFFYKMFETLNQRGEKLVTVDLFKNLLFEKFGNFVDNSKIEFFWKELIKISEDEEELKIFLRHYWLARYSFVREKDLYGEIRSRIIQEFSLNESGFLKLKKEILEFAKIYFALRDHNNSIWDNKTDLQNLIEELNYLNFVQGLPLLLSAFYKYGLVGDYFKKLLESYINLIVRNIVLLQRSPSEHEDLYSLLAREIFNESKDIDQVRKEILEKTPSDEKISSKFIGIELGIKNARYILCKINDSYSTEMQKIWKNKPTVEHILPKSPNEEYSKILDEEGIELSKILNRLGNLTLLGINENRELGNLPYHEKKFKYSESGIPLNKETILYSKNKFGLNELEEREKIILKMMKEKNLWGFKKNIS